MSSPSSPSGQNPRFLVPNALPVEIDRADLLHTERAKVIVLSAPSGYGKSTILAQYARQIDAPVWLRLNEEATDSRALLHDLAQASLAEGVTLHQWAEVHTVDASREQLLGALTEDLNTHDGDLTFCVDGGEYLSTESALMLASFASLLGEGHRLLVAQRDGSPFNAVAFVARGEGTIISADQLCFSADHTASAAQMLGDVQSPTDLQATYQGWPWGIMVALHTSQAGRDLPGIELAQAVLNTLPEAITGQLPALSVLEFWSVDSALSLGLTLPPDWIEQLQRVGLPMSPVGKGRFVPHDVVRELLTEHLRARPEQWQLMHARSAEQSEAQGELYSAIRHHVEAGQLGRAVHLAEELVPRWYHAADWRLAEQALNLIPHAHLSAELRSIHALAVLETGDLERGQALLEAQLADEPTGTTYFGLSLAAMRRDDAPLMREYVDAGLAIATQQRDIIQLMRGKAVFHTMHNEYEAALVAAQEAVDRAEGLGDASLRIASLNLKAYVLQRLGHPELAVREQERLYQAGVQLGQLHRLMPVVEQLAHSYTTMGRGAEAVHILESYLTACERSYPLATPTTQQRLGQVYFYLDRPEDGHRTLWAALDEFTRRGHYERMITSLYSLFFAGVLGHERVRVLDMFNHLQTLLREDTARTVPLTWISLHEMRAYAAYTAGDPDQAMQHLDIAADTMLSWRGYPLTYTALLQGQIHRERDQVTLEDATALRTALERQPFDLWELKAVSTFAAPLIQDYIDREWEADFFQEILPQVIGQTAAASAQVQLDLTTLGSVNVTLGDQAIKLGHASALEALIYLLLHPDARQDEIAAQVWDHGDLKRARQSAQVARSAMNAAFRNATQDTPFMGDLIVTAGQGRRNPQWVINPNVQIVTDVQAFLASASPDEMLRTRPEAFLNQSDSPWVQNFRETLTTHAVQALDQAAQTAEPLIALRYLVRIADLTQDPQRYERVIHLAQTLGQTTLHQAAEQALRDLERGNVASLDQR